jgi:hypothetical protein
MKTKLSNNPALPVVFSLFNLIIFLSLQYTFKLCYNVSKLYTFYLPA